MPCKRTLFLRELKELFEKYEVKKIEHSLRSKDFVVSINEAINQAAC